MTMNGNILLQQLFHDNDKAKPTVQLLENTAVFSPDIKPHLTSIRSHTCSHHYLLCAAHLFVGLRGIHSGVC